MHRKSNKSIEGYLGCITSGNNTHQIDFDSITTYLFCSYNYNEVNDYMYKDMKNPENIKFTEEQKEMLMKVFKTGIYKSLNEQKMITDEQLQMLKNMLKK